jgi:hypothetical protein
MAFPETNTPKRDPYGNANRDPSGTNPNSQFNYLNWILGLAALALIAFYIFGSAPATTPVVNSNPPSTSAPTTTPRTPAPVAPAPVTPSTP